MRLSSIWSSFSKKDVEQQFYKNPKFLYQVSFETVSFEIVVRYYKVSDNNRSEVKKDDIPQPTFSAMLQSDCWELV
jgi:hypothetical protein